MIDVSGLIKFILNISHCPHTGFSLFNVFHFNDLYSKEFVLTLYRNKNYISENNHLYKTRLKRSINLVLPMGYV